MRVRLRRLPSGIILTASIPLEKSNSYAVLHQISFGPRWRVEVSLIGILTHVLTSMHAHENHAR